MERLPHVHERNGRDHVRGIEAELVCQLMASGRRLAIVDVRTTDERRRGFIRDSISVPMHRLLSERSRLDPFKYDLVVVVSEDGVSSRLAGLELEFAGFSEVRTLEGGIARWTALGYPLDGRPT